MRRRVLLPLAMLVAGFVLAGCQDQSPTAVEQPGMQASVGSAVPGEWIVVFRNTVADPPGLARQLVASHGGQLHFTYQYALKGFSASLPDAAVAALQRNPNVAYVEQDQVMYAFGSPQSPVTWGLDRIDQRALPLNNSYTYTQTGAGVTAYIIDTGISAGHSEFTGRASVGADYVDDAYDGTDCNGHGTHVAGTVGGITYGVAKAVTLIAVRVLNCDGSGSTSGVVAGIDWVTGHRVLPAVANMSLGGGVSTTLDNAVRNSIAGGVSYAVAAGNGNFLGIAQNACNYSPARVTEAMTIGATNSSDVKASWSNYGSCVDWFAPGVSITSAWLNGGTNTISGTSMATPHTTGVAALYLQANPAASPQQVRDALYAATTKGVVTSSNTTNNHLLYSGTEPPANIAPTAVFTYPCTGLTCNFDGSGSSDSDGTITIYAWDFGDGSIDTGPVKSHTYSATGAYLVTLTVTDDDGAKGTTSHSVTVTAPGSIILSAVGRKVKGVRSADLTWSGATSANVDIYRNGVKLATTANDGFLQDPIGGKGGGTFIYQVCEYNSTSTCSNQATVTF